MLKIDTTTRDELKQFFIIALPLSAAYLAEFAMFLTTKMVVGKLGYHSLAAVGIAGDLSFEFLIIFLALLSVVGVLSAQAFGAGRNQDVGDAVRQGLIVATGLGLPTMLVIWNMDFVLVLTNQDPKVVELAQAWRRLAVEQASQGVAPAGRTEQRPGLDEGGGTIELERLQLRSGRLEATGELERAPEVAAVRHP